MNKICEPADIAFLRHIRKKRFGILHDQWYVKYGNFGPYLGSGNTPAWYSSSQDAANGNVLSGTAPYPISYSTVNGYPAYASNFQPSEDFDNDNVDSRMTFHTQNIKDQIGTGPEGGLQYGDFPQPRWTYFGGDVQDAEENGVEGRIVTTGVTFEIQRSPEWDFQYRDSHWTRYGLKVVYRRYITKETTQITDWGSETVPPTYETTNQVIIDSTEVAYVVQQAGASPSAATHTASVFVPNDIEEYGTVPYYGDAQVLIRRENYQGSSNGWIYVTLGTKFYRIGDYF